MGVLNAMRFGLAVFFLLIFSYVIVESRSFPGQAALFPEAVGVMGFVLALVTLVLDVRRYRASGAAIGHDEVSSTASTAAYEPGAPVGYVFARAARYLGWCLGYLLLMFVGGVKGAAIVFLVAFLMIEASVKLRYVWLAPLFMYGLLTLLQEAVNLRWPPSLFEIVP